MKILVLSDSHRITKYMLLAVEQEQPHHIIHLGDHSADAEALSQTYPNLPVFSVRGNCDYDPTAQEEIVAEISGIRLLISHGHRHHVKSSLLPYELRARECGAQIALFGHTHRAFCEEYNGLWMLNPGSCGSCGTPSYGIIEINNDRYSCRLCYFDE